jgi:GT2 family glycosyltransferase
VVIPTFNRRDLVVQAVKSVITQTYQDLSCVVVDNGSNDGTAEALASLQDQRLKVLQQAKPMGGAGARNIGIDAAGSAEWVAFLDSDDMWAPTKLERQLGALSLNPEAGWSATACINIGPDLRALHSVRFPAGPPRLGHVSVYRSEELRPLLLEENSVPAGNSTVLAARALLQSVGGYDPGLATCDDWDLWARLAVQSPFAYLDHPLTAYRIWGGQSSADERAFLRDAATIRSRNFPDSGRISPSYLARWERESARRDVALGRRLPAANHFVRAAWAGRSPGQLVYAIASATIPGFTESRLRRIERERGLPQGWEADVEPWLAVYRQDPARSTPPK